MTPGRDAAPPSSPAQAVRTSADLLSTIEGGRLRLVINRPQALNALTPGVLFELAKQFTELAGDPLVRYVTIEGSGDEAFSAGFDIKVLAELGPDAHRGDPLGAASDAIASCPKITVAIIRGHCLGAGLELAMSCDFRVATDGSRFAVPAIRLGTFYRPRAIERFWRMLGPSVTKALFVAAHEFSAEEALRVGIVEELAPPPALDDVATTWANVSEQGADAAAAHKLLIDALGAEAHPGPDFWLPFDELRNEFLTGRQRADALESFRREHNKTGVGPTP